jgi:hypothetical protein
MSPTFGTSEMVGKALRAAVAKALEAGSITYLPHARQRMAERQISSGDVINCLTRGRMAADGRDHGGNWKYVATWTWVCVVFVLELDEAGNAVIVVTVHES